MTTPGAARPAGDEVRAPHDGDAAAIASLYASIETALYGYPETSEGEVRFVWGWPRFDRSRDAWLVSGSGGVAGYAWVWGPRLPNPDYDGSMQLPIADEGRAAATALIDRMESRVREMGRANGFSQAPCLVITCSSRDERKRDALVARGYHRIRTFFRMERGLETPFPPPRWPAGMEVALFRPGADEAPVHEAIQESFADHFRFVAESLEDWRAYKHPDFAPDLTFLVRDQGRVAAASANYRSGDEGWVGMLGVRRPWRRRGLATALLLESFETFRRAGCKRACLGVDSENADDAPRIYEAVGMSVTRREDFFQRTLD